MSTIDQLINASTRLKHNALRWLAISGKILILDEVHDFDEYTFALIKKTVEWCGALGVPVIAMSATLSGRAQRELVNAYYKRDKEAMNRAQRESLSESIDLSIPKEGLPSPYWVYFPAGNAAAAVHSSKLELPKYPIYNASLDVVSAFVPSVVFRTAEHLEKDAMVLVVCHTVKQAVETYRTLRAEMPEEDIQLLHSRMAQERKAEVIDDLLVKTGKPDGKGNNSRNRMVLVTTQIVQQSMDIDFDVLITPLAPLPELFQRVGRIYRHEQGDERASAYRNSPRLHILVQEDVANYRSFTSTKDFSEQGQASFAPYSKWALLSSYEVLVKTLGKVNTCASWDAKSTMSQSFTAHEELRGACESELDSVPALLVSVHKEHESTIKEKESKGEFAAISAPGEDPAVLYDITESFTPRSAKASPTRLIEETETVLPVWLNDKGEWFLDENCKQPMPKASSMQSLRMIGKKSLNIPKHLADKYIEPLADLDERYAFVTYVKPFDVTQLDESLGYSKEEGFVPAVVVPSQTTWL